jgi:DUF4097 and DUF4098 domain-containing protein YvlB
MPPNVPPGGPWPPYDSKAQWQAWRDQQKAAWRAQRDAYKAQRSAWKTQYSGYYVPRVPSVVGPVILVGIGVVAMLMTTGHLNSGQFWDWYGHWWPLLLIVAGLGLLGEWFLDMRSKTPVRRSSSFVGILILLAFIGIGAAGWNHFWGPFRANFGDQSGDFFNHFGLPEHDNDHQVANTGIPVNANIEIRNPRGDVSISASDGQILEVQSHEVAFSNSDEDARKVFDSEKPGVRIDGNNVLIQSSGNDSGRVDLTISVPKSAHVTVSTGHGDTTIAGLGAGINLEAPNGDVHLSDITGAVYARLSSGHHDFSAHQVSGDVSLDGSCEDLTLSEIKGKVNQNGEIMGDVHIENIAGSLHLHTSLTDLQIAQLPGDLTLNSDDLRVNEARGQVRVTTKSKDIDLSQIYGDSVVETRNGRIAVEPAGNYAVEAKNGRGDVEVTLPPTASAAVNANVRNGDILSDFNAPEINGGATKVANFHIGSGSARIVLSAENGDVRIKKGSAVPPAPPARPAPPAEPKSPEAPRAPVAPKAPEKPGAQHLKSTKGIPSQPTAQ